MIFHLNLEDLVVYMGIGIHNWEKTLKQKVLVSISISHIREENSPFLDYSVLSSEVINFLEKSRYDLLEDVIEDLLTFIMDYNNKITECTVKLHKPLASFMLFKALSIIASKTRN